MQETSGHLINKIAQVSSYRNRGPRKAYARIRENPRITWALHLLSRACSKIARFRLRDSKQIAPNIICLSFLYYCLYFYC